ncbi:unnamed protein product [Caenorhabditis brenneri]
MTMKKWRFFPLLVKENIVRNMCIRDIISFAKCSKKCQNLLSAVPIHRSSFLIDDNIQLRNFFGPGMNLDMGLIPLDHFSILATSRKFFVDKFDICVTTEKYKHDSKNLIEKLTKERKSLKVKELRMNFEVEHAELFREMLGICDSSRIESIEIPKLYSQVIYEELVKTPQWKNSKRVMLNSYGENRRLVMPNVNIDDFLHFENVQLRVDRLDTNDAVKLVQNFRNYSVNANFVIECQKPMQQDLIRQKIQAGWVGNWHQSQLSNIIIDPAKRLSFAKCSKKCRNLLAFVPIHLPVAVIDDSPQAVRRPNFNPNHLIPLNDFSIFATSQKFHIDRFDIYDGTAEHKNNVNAFIGKLTESLKLLKVKELRKVIGGGHVGLFTKLVGVCDPSCIESIAIPAMFSQNVYDELVNTPQWKNCKRVLLNNMRRSLLIMSPTVNIDDFLHFEDVQLGVKTLDTDDAVKFVQSFRNAAGHAEFVIECRERIQQDLIRQKIEAGWVGDWQQSQHATTRFVINPAKPDHVFYIESSPFHLRSGWSLLDEFNAFQVFIGGLLAVH